MSIDAYQTMEEEIEDLRLAALAFARLKNFNPDDALSHRQMMNKFGK